MMTLAELIEHTDNIEALLAIKRHQLDHMQIDAYARRRHELAIDALEHRVGELRRAVELLRSDPPTLQLRCVHPCVPPAVDMSVQPEAVGDLPATARKIGA